MGKYCGQAIRKAVGWLMYKTHGEAGGSDVSGA